jgi:hypothetical protein
MNFPGTIDGVRVPNVARTPEEITDYYDSNRGHRIGVGDSYGDACDNCPYVYDLSQIDSDGDGAVSDNTYPINGVVLI